MRIRRIVYFAAAVTACSAAAAATGYVLAVRPWWRSWGVDHGEAERELTGDDLVPDALIADTRGIDIGAPPEAVWPWLVQMGFDRAGWYSYDVVDMRGASADQIDAELQTLAVGDAIPSSPQTAFVARVVDPERALVLYVDEQLIEEQMAAARAAVDAGQPMPQTPANLRATGAMMPSMSGFAASWAFVLEPRDGGTHTRLIERFRLTMAPDQKGGGVARSFMWLGVFVMTRKQMLGIRDRVERARRRGTDLAGSRLDP